MEERKLRAAQSLANGAKAAAVARELDVNRSTVTRWLQEEDFQAEIARIQGDQAQAAITGLHDLVGEALETIRKAIAGEVPAAQGNHALNVIKTAALVEKAEGGGTSDFEERLRELDARDTGKPD